MLLADSIQRFRADWEPAENFGRVRGKAVVSGVVDELLGRSKSDEAVGAAGLANGIAC